ncbi:MULTISPECIES: oxidoreductase [Nocardiopsis]|uniref:Short-chain dehydrogenase/reductase SDR n=1 Tax=Nocardiopsis dassonvillei (strain ATCC 23218 / DSM 43111 / CIP 107115 / JCM 7437 / KCTC 9190 / NBRC 14626 / NCTC 10488 / NRRL B-5397 / IMRU 509) TaxID=446468 RepID=D7B6A9_NOCDD|nr:MULTISPECIES: oxidoreductase [Nocardiopsis]ADH67374.1 short-chain dehydrogenase/reductase SDR [Nocardiopsis dassonvillei subsp. dassonvillei DSM 43111]APC35584.1 oxidoreductase [Nocardiopsis dassonvillei]NKY77377.1 SDR family NAD(P)-dependent oxidoreductase [Nocardiopsis dassonvillei]VEI87514.1 NADP-dependent 3-hydroxy acid dehydrogenase YdfG [Nocardiopsis dassonvillei]
MTAQHWTPADIPPLDGRTALITGANSGIGYRTARALARHGARVLLTGRRPDALAEAAARLRGDVPGARLETVELDLGDLAAIRDAAAPLAAEETIDILVNNAGVMNVPQRRTTRDGLELTVGTNHLGHFALTAHLMPALTRSAAARIVTVSAIAATWRSGDLTDLMSEQRYRPMGAYAKSKRANIVFTRELARRLDGSAHRALAVHPGSAVTNLQRHTSTGRAGRLFVALAARTLMGSPEGAAWPSLYGATHAAAANGAFLGPAGRDQTSGTPEPTPLPAGADSPEQGSRLWRESERLTGVAFPVPRT